MTSNEGFTPTFDPDPDSVVMTPEEIMEQMIDYIVNHKDNLNGNILIEMLSKAQSASNPIGPGAGTLPPGDGGGISI